MFVNLLADEILNGTKKFIPANQSSELSSTD
jgi:hypothetical protein